MSFSSYFSRRNDLELAKLGDQINPARLAQVRFDVARRGYSRDQVDTYKARAVAALEESERRRSDAESAMRSLQNRLRMLETRGAAAPIDADAIRIMAVAQQQADVILQRSEEVARQTEEAAKLYYNDVVARAHQAASLAAGDSNGRADSGGVQDADRSVRERERSIAYLRTFLEVVRVGRAEVAAYEPVLEKMLDAAELVMSGLQQIEQHASSALRAAERQTTRTHARSSKAGDTTTVLENA